MVHAPALGVTERTLSCGWPKRENPIDRMGYNGRSQLKDEFQGVKCDIFQPSDVGTGWRTRLRDISSPLVLSHYAALVT